jgi:hypothetical protein
MVQRNCRRSRRSLLWAATFFCTAQVVGGLLLDYRWPQIRFPSFHQVLDELDGMSPHGPDVIFVGSSRFASGLDRGILEERLRSALGDKRLQILLAMVPAGDCIYADYFLDQLLDRGKKPRVLIVEVSPETVACRNRWLEVHAARQFTWPDVPHFLLDTCRSNQLHRLLQARLLPLVVHRRQICRAAWQTLVPEQAPAHKGVVWPRAWSDKSSDERSVGGAAFIAQWLEHYQSGGTAAESLERVLRRCHERGISVVLVAPPLHTDQRMLYVPAIEEAFGATMSRLTRTYDCQFVDYRNRLPDSVFFDNHHLVPAGAEQFTALIVNDLLGNGRGQAAVGLAQAY